MGKTLDEIGPDTPLRLREAAQIAFPNGGMTESGLRREAKRGNLTIERIAGKDFTTLAAIKRMRELCRATQRESASGSEKSAVTPPDVSARQNGLSGTETSRSAQAAVAMIAKGLKRRSPPTSPRGIAPTQANVIPINCK
jgi:hypothetical protein